MVSIGIKATQLLTITLFCVFVFAMIYNKAFKRSMADAFYVSMLNQSMVGGNASSQLPDDLEKLIIGFQCVLAFFISSGMVILFVSN